VCEVTVVIPTWNRWRLLSQAALPAALAQQRVDLEIVVVDDGSTDETPDRLAELAAREGRVRVVTHKSRRGVAQARNAGIEAAQGEWVAFLDDDDLWSPEKLRRQLLAARAANAELVYSGAVMLDTAWRAIAEEPPPSPVDLARTLLSRNLVPAGCSNVMATRKLVRRHGGFDEQLYQLADWDLWLRLALDARAACTPEPLVGYATHLENMVIETRSDVLQELDYLQRKHEAVSRAYGVRFDRLWLARWVAGSNRRAGRRLRASALYLRAGLEHRSRRDVVRAGSVLTRRLVPSVVARLAFSTKARLRGSGSRIPEMPRDPDWLHSYRLTASGGQG
jgi:glycosyltransferase involved in cell wall biosynthesis